MKTKQDTRISRGIKPIARHSTKLIYVRSLRRAAVLLFAIAFVGTGETRDIYVDGTYGQPDSLGSSWSDPTITITRAIFLAAPGDTIHVATGTYEENVVLTDSLTLLGGYPSGVVNRPANTPRNPTTNPTIISARRITGDCVVCDKGSQLDGFILQVGQNGALPVDAAIRVTTGNDVFVTRTRVEGGSSYGIVVDGGSARVQRCSFADCSHGIYLTGDQPAVTVENSLFQRGAFGVIDEATASGTIDITSCTIQDCSQDGIQKNCSALTVLNTIITECDRHCVSVSTNGLIFLNNNVFGDNMTLYFGMDSMTGIAGNISADPLLDPSGKLTAGSPCVDAGMVIAGTSFDLEGTARPFGAQFDIGADELGWVFSTPEVTSVDLDGQLALAGTTHLAYVTVSNLSAFESILVETVDLTFTDQDGHDASSSFLTAPVTGNISTIAPGSTSTIAVSVTVSTTATSITATVGALISGQAQSTGTPFWAETGNLATGTWQILGCTVGICGDCTGDGRVDIIDSWLAARIAVGLSPCPSAGTPSFDSCNVAGMSTPDGGAGIDALDALALAQDAVGGAGVSCCR